jgi:hypothetical protein
MKMPNTTFDHNSLLNGATLMQSHNLQFKILDSRYLKISSIWSDYAFM